MVFLSFVLLCLLWLLLKLASTPRIFAQVFLKALPLFSVTVDIPIDRQGDKHSEVSEAEPVTKGAHPSVFVGIECRIMAKAEFVPHSCMGAQWKRDA